MTESRARSIAMRKIALQSLILGGVGLASCGALADSSPTAPQYIGDRSKNPEQETYAYLPPPATMRVLVFIGPTKRFGAITGVAEKDTIGYLPLIAVEQDGRWWIDIAER
jgi:hypothetical protein